MLEGEVADVEIKNANFAQFRKIFAYLKIA